MYTVRRIDVRAALFPGVPRSQAGPRLVALRALLMGCFNQCKRRGALYLERVLSQLGSPVWAVKLHDQAASALWPAYEKLVQTLPAHIVPGLD